MSKMIASVKSVSSKVASDNRLGVQVADLTADQRKELDLEGGVLVDDIGEGAYEETEAAIQALLNESYP